MIFINNYDYRRTEQRLNLNKEILAATAQVLEKVPISHITSQLSSQHVGSLFLQLNVRDIGLCVPFSLDPTRMGKQEVEAIGAIVATVESTSISACSASSTVSRGKFEDLCVRFSDDFDHSFDDWKPDHTDPNLINLCTVAEGSYEICNRTTKASKEENAKWLLHIQWQMTGEPSHTNPRFTRFYVGSLLPLEQMLLYLNKFYHYLHLLF